MAYDEELTSRMRYVLRKLDGVEEKRMMGGVCFMLRGHMLGGVKREKSGKGRFTFRVGKPNMHRALENPTALPVQFGARRLGGFVHVDEADCDDEILARWIDQCVSFVDTLPPKEK